MEKTFKGREIAIIFFKVLLTSVKTYIQELYLLAVFTLLMTEFGNTKLAIANIDISMPKNLVPTSFLLK